MAGAPRKSPRTLTREEEQRFMQRLNDGVTLRELRTQFGIGYVQARTIREKNMGTFQIGNRVIIHNPGEKHGSLYMIHGVVKLVMESKPALITVMLDGTEELIEFEPGELMRERVQA
jgi:hypothetical protein